MNYLVLASTLVLSCSSQEFTAVGTADSLDAGTGTVNGQTPPSSGELPGSALPDADASALPPVAPTSTGTGPMKEDPPLPPEKPTSAEPADSGIDEPDPVLPAPDAGPVIVDPAPDAVLTKLFSEMDLAIQDIDPGARSINRYPWVADEGGETQIVVKYRKGRCYTIVAIGEESISHLQMEQLQKVYPDQLFRVNVTYTEDRIAHIHSCLVLPPLSSALSVEMFFKISAIKGSGMVVIQPFQSDEVP